MLDDTGWEWQDVATGEHTMQATTLPDNYAYEMQEASRAEGGAMFFDGLYATFRPFGWLSTYPRSVVPQAYPGRGELGDPELTAADSLWTAQLIVNDAQLSQVGGSRIRVQDTASQSAYEHRTFEYLQYYNDSDTDLTAIANRMVDAFAWDYQRLQSVTMQASTPEQASSVLALLLGDLLRVTVPLTLRGWGYTTEAHINGIGWLITPSDWVCVVRVDQSLRGAPGDARAFSDGFDSGYQ
jgi:hypothetical protein